MAWECLKHIDSTLENPLFYDVSYIPFPHMSTCMGAINISTPCLHMGVLISTKRKKERIGSLFLCE